MKQKQRKKIINQAILLAKSAFKKDEVPVGCVIFHSQTGEIVALAHNQVEARKNPLAHAEMRAIEKALKKLKTKYLDGYSMFITLEPCVMCAGAIAWARLDAVYYGAADPKTGAVRQGAKVFTRSQTHHKLKTRLTIVPECAQLMTDFFAQKRQMKKIKKVVDFC